MLDIAQQQSPVLFATDSTNITKAIIDAYNVKSGVPAPASPAADPAQSCHLRRSRLDKAAFAVARHPSSKRPSFFRAFSLSSRLQFRCFLRFKKVRRVP